MAESGLFVSDEDFEEIDDSDDEGVEHVDSDDQGSENSFESLRVGLGSQGTISDDGLDADSSSVGFTHATPSVQSLLPPVAPAIIPGYRTRKKPGKEIRRWNCIEQCPFTDKCPHLPTGPANPDADCRDWYAPAMRDYQERLAIESHTDINMTPADHATLQRLSDFMTISARARQAGASGGANFDETMRSWVIEVRSLKVDRYKLVRSSVLNAEWGLPSVFTRALIRGHEFATDIKFDCAYLYCKWENRKDYDPDSMRGIIVRFVTNSKGRTTLSRKLDQERLLEFRDRKGACYIGSGRLFIGQWWPFLICLVRDGAHGATESGIYGHTELGALSIILSRPKRRSDYADIDMGDEIEYVGTMGRPKTADDDDDLPDHYLRKSKNTELLFKSLETGNPVRVCRSWKMPYIQGIIYDLVGRLLKMYKPDLGYRYDGLYDVVAVEAVKIEEALYRFKLVRRPNQGPIRCQGPGLRSNAADAVEFAKIRAAEKRAKRQAQADARAAAFAETQAVNHAMDDNLAMVEDPEDEDEEV